MYAIRHPESRNHTVLFYQQWLTSPSPLSERRTFLIELSGKVISLIIHHYENPPQDLHPQVIHSATFPVGLPTNKMRETNNMVKSFFDSDLIQGMYSNSVIIGKWSDNPDCIVCVRTTLHPFLGRAKM